MRNPLEPLLSQFGVVILDGGLASELERRGADLDDPLWSAKLLLEAPELIESVHLDYFRAGADVAITASYQANVQALRNRGLSEGRAVECIQSSVRIAQRARDQYWREVGQPAGRPVPLVAGAVGCYGAFLHDGSEYRGHYSVTAAELIAFHRPRMRALVDAAPDLLACETIPCKTEAEALVQLLGEFPDMPSWMTFSCGDERHVWEGQTLRECFEVADASAQVVAVGINCTAPHLIEGLLSSVDGATEKPIVVYPNSGEAWDQERHTWLAGSATLDLPTLAEQWYRMGARIIGGCCRTTPETIRGIASTLRPAE